MALQTNDWFHLYAAQGKTINKRSQSFTALYDFWFDWLFERCLHLYEWEGPEEDGVPVHEIEAITMANGIGFTTDKYKGKLSHFVGGYSGEPTQYIDRFTKFSVKSPVFSKILKVDKEGVVLRNTASCQSMMPLCHYYAVQLAHTGVTFINVMINARDAGGKPIAGRPNQVAALEKYRTALFNGNVMPINDPGFAGVEFKDTKSTLALSPLETLECVDKLLSGFFNAIGIRSVWNKRGNQIQAEVTGSDSMLLYNLTDGLKQREIYAEGIKKLYGKTWVPKIAKELRYDEEEQNNGTQGDYKEPMENKQQE